MENPFQAGFYSSPFGGITTSFSGSKFPNTRFKPLDKTSFSPATNMFPVVGLDTTTGERDRDLLPFLKMPPQQPADASTGYDVGSAVPGLSKEAQDWFNAYTATSPLRRKERAEEYELMSRLSQQQLQQLYPYLSRAGAEATARSLAASQAFRSFAEQMPSNVQNIMASKQNQMFQAAAGEAERQRATAEQARAAKEFGGIRYAGQTFSVA